MKINNEANSTLLNENIVLHNPLSGMEWLTWSYSNWDNLPVHILLHIFSYLSRHDQLHAALTCNAWCQVFTCSNNWKHYVFKFFTQKDSRHNSCVKKYGHYLRNVKIHLDQYESINREEACLVIRSLAEVKERRLEKLAIYCMGRNPLFYAGLEFVYALQYLVGPPPENCKIIRTLTFLDLSGLPVLFDDVLFEILADNHPKLEYLNIQNSPLICKVTPTCILHLAQRCRNLKDLRILNCSLSEEVLNAFIEENRVPLKHLAITCRREEKYAKDISSHVWKKLALHLPDLRVTLRFDHTCPLHKISKILQCGIPCSVLRLETFTYIHDEIKQASVNYCKTLEKVIVQTRPSPELNEAILMLSDCCPKLNALHIFCTLDKETIDCVLEKHPKLKERGTYTLKHEVGPDGVWVSEDELMR